jgi:NitT/TauT family transport system substrate-binding protein
MIWPFNPSYGIIACEDILDAEELKTFIRLHEDMSNLIIKSPRRAAETVAEVVGLVESDFVLEVIKLSPHYCASLPREYIQSTLKFVPVMLELGYLSKPLSEEDVFYTGIIKEIHQENNHYSRALKT